MPSLFRALLLCRSSVRPRSSFPSWRPYFGAPISRRRWCSSFLAALFSFPLPSGRGSVSFDFFSPPPLFFKQMGSSRLRPLGHPFFFPAVFPFFPEPRFPTFPPFSFFFFSSFFASFFWRSEHHTFSILHSFLCPAPAYPPFVFRQDLLPPLKTLHDVAVGFDLSSSVQALSLTSSFLPSLSPFFPGRGGGFSPFFLFRGCCHRSAPHFSSPFFYPLFSLFFDPPAVAWSSFLPFFVVPSPPEPEPVPLIFFWLFEPPFSDLRFRLLPCPLNPPLFPCAPSNLRDPPASEVVPIRGHSFFSNSLLPRSYPVWTLLAPLLVFIARHPGFLLFFLFPCLRLFPF